jgi:hypothetical protein
VNDGGGVPTARILYRAAQTGIDSIVATSFSTRPAI